NERLQEVEEQIKSLQQSLKDEESRLLGVEGAVGAGNEEDLRAELLDVLSASAQHRNEVRYLDQQEETLVRRAEKLLKEIAQAEQERDEATTKLAQLQEQVKAAADQI